MSFFNKLEPIKLPAKYSTLSPTERYDVRELYTVKQKGLCYYCYGSLASPPPEDILEKRVTPRLYPEGFFTRPMHLHHDHKTDLTLGVVHAYCNAVLWEHHNE